MEEYIFQKILIMIKNHYLSLLKLLDWWPQKWIYLSSLLLAVVSGFIAYYLSLPLPWMLGPLIGCSFFSAIGKQVIIGKKPRPICRALLGCTIGANFGPEILDRVSEIGISLLFIPGFILLMGLTTYWYLSKFMKMDRPTSIYASIPGGLNEMVILGQELGADPRTLVLIHATRIVVVVFLASLFILFVPKLGVQTLPQPDLFYNWTQLPFVFLISILGWYMAVKLKIPGPTIIGPMILSAFMHIFEIVDAMPMYILVIAVQVLLGAALGCLFKNITLKEMSGPILAGFVTTIISIIPLAIIYFILTQIGYDPLSILLAFSPGGQSEMNILALSIGADMSFISPHHMFRVFLVIIFASLIHKVIKKIR
jgi:membrane AbrB-like protein